jgi:hypothetical protein
MAKSFCFYVETFDYILKRAYPLFEKVVKRVEKSVETKIAKCIKSFLFKKKVSMLKMNEFKQKC